MTKLVPRRDKAPMRFQVRIAEIIDAGFYPKAFREVQKFNARNGTKLHLLPLEPARQWAKQLLAENRKGVQS